MLVRVEVSVFVTKCVFLAALLYLLKIQKKFKTNTANCEAISKDDRKLLTGYTSIRKSKLYVFNEIIFVVKGILKLQAIISRTLLRECIF